MGKSAAALLGPLTYGPAPEADTEAMAWLKKHENKFGLFINGQFTDPGKELLETTAPSDGRKLAQFTQATPENVEAAVKAAQDAQKKWAKLSGAERHQYLYALYRHIEKNSRLFAVLESLDNGKSIRETRDIDVKLAARHFRYYGGLAQTMGKELDGYEPQGVAGQIIPWNFPLLMLAWKVAPALAAGNAVVLKPAEQTPLTALLFAEICQEVGLPPGLVNIVTGDGKVGAEITQHKDINKVAFTGSTEVGRIIREATAGTGKGLTLELGGKSPFIVFDDADIDTAVEGVVDAIWFNQGEVCCGGSRLLVQESVHDKFIEKLTARLGKLRVGHSLDKAIDMGAIIDATQQQRISDFVEEARNTPGRTVYQGACPAKGCYYPPTLVTGVEPTDRIVREEVFGPVLTAMKFRTFDEAIQLANNTAFGLAASVWTESSSKAKEVASRVKAGVIWINSTNNFDASVGFGGYKESGYGREGGREGLMSYLRAKSEAKRPAADVAAPLQTYKTVASQAVDQTPKMFINGAEPRPDGGNSLKVVSPKGVLLGEVGKGNRKDIRNAVEAAAKAESWSASTKDNRGQILRFIGEKLESRADEFTKRLQMSTGMTKAQAKREVQQSIQTLFNFAALAEDHEGRVHQPPANALVVSLNEPLGVVGVAAPNEKPLLSLVTLIAANMAAGNRSVVVPSEKYPLLATDFVQVLRASDVPNGVVNIVTGGREELSKTLSEHLNVDAVWYHGSAEGSKAVETAAARSNLKQTWTNVGKAYDWNYLAGEGGRELMNRATQVKNIWVPWKEGVGPK